MLDLRTLNAVANWHEWYPDGAATLDDARARLEAAVDAWALHDLRPLGGWVAIVLAGRSLRRDIVVKVNPRVTGRTDEQAGEAAALAFWGPTGAAVAPLKVRDGGATILLERLRPGTSLHHADQGQSATLQTLGALAARLHAVGSPPAGEFVHLAASSLGRKMTAALHDEPEAAELAELLQPDTGDVLIHTDLHPLNALQADGGYKVIDPTPHVADRHADIYALLYGPNVALPDSRHEARRVATKRVAQYAAAAGLDGDRVRAWTRLRARSIEQWVAGLAQPRDRELRWARQMGDVASALR